MAATDIKTKVLAATSTAFGTCKDPATKAALDAEITRAKAAEADAKKAATDEATRAKAAESALGTRITALETKVGDTTVDATVKSILQTVLATAYLDASGTMHFTIE